jgi:predicted membrane protein
VKQSSNNNGLFWGLILVLLGVLFLLDNFYIIDFSEAISTFWPLILIVIGIKILLDKKRDNSHHKTDSGTGPINMKSYKESGSGRISESNVFGDIHMKIDSESFTGASVNNVFGDIRLDLSGVKLTQEITKIHVSGVFGDVTIDIPDGIALNVRSNSVAGDISIRGNRKDGLFPNLTYQDEAYVKAKQKIDLQCSIVFGSINVH